MKTLAPDDFRAGQYIIGLGGPTRETSVYGDGAFGPPTAVRSAQDNSWRGDIFLVEHVELPFIVIREVVNRYGMVSRTGFGLCRSMNHCLGEGFRWGLVSNEMLAAHGLRVTQPTHESEATND